MNIGDILKNCLQLKFEENKINNQNTEKESNQGGIHTSICTYKHFLFRDMDLKQSPRTDCESLEKRTELKRKRRKEQ